MIEDFVNKALLVFYFATMLLIAHHALADGEPLIEAYLIGILVSACVTLFIFASFCVVTLPLWGVIYLSKKLWEAIK